MYFIAGVTGHVGSVAANELMSKGAKIRVLVRDEAKGAPWRAKGADVVIGTLGDTATLTKALTGVQGAFLLVPPPGAPAALASAETVYAYQRDLVGKIAEAVKASHVPHVVLLSSIGAQHPDGTGPIQGLHHAEKALSATGAKHTFIRACSFMENHAGAVGAVLGMGVFPNFLAEDVPMHQIATQDIGHAVARALLDAPAASTIVNLVGPREYTAIEIKDAFAKVAGKPVQFANMPLEAAEGAMLKWGMPPGMAAAYADMYRGVASGRVAYLPGAVFTRGSVPLETVVTALFKSAPAAH